ncbi:HAD family hydrolase [Paenibacillus xylaniclasticus]|uniref:HAD family hydrolase n=1 Tax=Paenibacillus xylaniclasticus TaxID=588083 RepID=UPI000FD911AC|nr:MULTISPECIES: HAD family hydrolase [Paenibacillus]GFN34110.1 haloacid dehalogenase [Paenibacillus curdlanolyticus]
MNTQTIIFDLDDTLIHCNKYFGIVIEQFLDHMMKLFPDVDRSVIRSRLMEIDLASVEANGLTMEHLPESFVATYSQFQQEQGEEVDNRTVDQLYTLGLSVFSIPVEPLPEMVETLDRLREEGCSLVLHTGGDESNQYRKIMQLELSAYFDTRIFISKHKDTAALRRIMDQLRLQPSDTWMIGNSLRTDIMPGLAVGVNVIHIPAEDEWEFNNIDIDVEPQGAFLTLKSLKEVPDAIRAYLVGRKIGR